MTRVRAVRLMVSHTKQLELDQVPIQPSPCCPILQLHALFHIVMALDVCRWVTFKYDCRSGCIVASSQTSDGFPSHSMTHCVAWRTTYQTHLAPNCLHVPTHAL